MPDSTRRMYQIQSYDSIGSRHATYQRELERLATEAEDLLDVLDEGKPDGVAYVATQLRKALDRVHAAGVLEFEKKT